MAHVIQMARMPKARLQAVPSTGRVSRRPSHPFQLRTRPWQIQPMLIAPVLPGETLKNLLLQARVVTDPIKSPLLGWHKEYYFFYVKLRDLEGRDDFTEMFLDAQKDLSAYETAALQVTNHVADTIDWAYLCLQRVVEEYFRNEGETWTSPDLGGLPMASVGDIRWLDSVVASGTYDNNDVDLTGAGSEAGVAVTTHEIDTAMRAYENARMLGLTAMSYEDYLGTYGVRTVTEELHRPELIRYVKDWTYPSNTIDPTTGAPTSAASWSIAERADKDRFFKEPGFIFGVTVTRPKIYFRLNGQANALMNSMFPWLPRVMEADPMSSLVAVPDVTGPLGNVTDAAGYIVDIRDLFLYGDQFHNFANTATDAGFIDVPTADLVKRYADSADADALFVSVSPANQIREDGVVSLTILGSQVDHTPSMTGGVLR